MNCWTSSGRIEFDVVEPSAPPYYARQPPYNPEFYHYYQDDDDPWDVRDEDYAQVVYESDSDAGGWGRRRSLYEGVSCAAPAPVSAST